MKIIKILFAFILLTQLLLSATPEQIDKYLSVSSSEEQLIELESQFSEMQKNINSMSSGSSDYDMQLLSIRFREYLQKNISEDEMDEILKQYKNVVLLKFVSVQNDAEYDPDEAKAYMEELGSEENASVRLDLLEKISNTLYNDENIGILFDHLMKPFLQNSKNAQDMDKSQMKKNKEAYIKAKRENGKTETAYSTKEFTIEELESLSKIVKTPAIDHESKAVFAATAYALQEFFLSMANRYDAKKHQKDKRAP